MTQLQSSVSVGTSPKDVLERLSTTLVPELKRYLKHHRGQVQELIAQAGSDSGQPASLRYAKVVDGLISALFHAAQSVMSKEGTWRPVALNAVGSYGRRSLSLFSDLDVRLLCPDVHESAEIAEALLYPLWDAGLNIGHQVVSASEVLELAKRDLPTATSLLDWRHLAGDQAMNAEFQRRTFEEVFSGEYLGEFVTRLSTEAHDRRERFGGSVFLLEPDLKNGAGGLRDVDLAHWAARARWRVDGLGDLVRVGVLLPDEWTALEAAISFIMKVRNNLHHRGKLRVDRLSFDDQEYIAERLRFGSGGSGVEAFMSEYYRHAREIERMCELVLRRAAPPPKKRPKEIAIGDGMKLVGDVVAFDYTDAIYSEPHMVFGVYEQAIERGKGVSDVTRRAITRALGAETFRAQLRNDERAIASFKRLLCSAAETKFRYDSILTELHDVGLLLTMIPEFAPVVGRVHHDVYHTYTVDVHSIAATDRMRAFFQAASAGSEGASHPKHANTLDTFPVACSLAADLARKEVLLFATLLHDVGKDLGGAKHPERGVELAQIILERLKVKAEDIRLVQHLILKHLRMYHTATRRDIDDPLTLEQFAEEVKTPEGLRDLYLLTVADVSTTSPTALTSWKQKMLDELFQATDRWLTHGETRGAGQAAIAVEVLRQLPGSVDEGFARSLLQSLPPRYLGAHDVESVLSHLGFAFAARDARSEIRVLRSGDPHVELAVIADDQPGLLAQICATFSKQSLKVVSAQVYSYTDPSGHKRALDLFWVRSGQDPARVANVLPTLNTDLAELLSGERSPRDLVNAKKREAQLSLRPSPAVPIQVRVDNGGASRHTILEVIAKDRADLLFWVSQMIYNAGLSIELAKIHTEGVRVTDVFYVCTAENQKLVDERQIEALRESIKATLLKLQEGTQP